MRLVFLGTPDAAVPALDALIAAGHEVRLAVTRPDRPRGRSRLPEPPPVKRYATERGIDLFQPPKVRDAAFLERVASVEPDALVVVAYGRILPEAVLELGRQGAVNLHFSLLPRYRGAAPVQWALARGDRRTGVTTMLMSEGLDEGDILLQREVDVLGDEHAPALEGRLARLGASLLVETLAGLAAGTIEPRPQEGALATFAPPLTAADGALDPVWTAEAIEGRVRGFDPWPGAWLARGRSRLRLVDATAIEGRAPADVAPGTVTSVDVEGAVVVCGGASRLLVRQVQPQDRRVMSARDAINGRQIAIGDRLERPSATD